MVLRPVTPALPHIDMHIALAYNRQSTSDSVPLFVEVVREVVEKQRDQSLCGWHRSDRRGPVEWIGVSRHRNGCGA